MFCSNSFNNSLRDFQQKKSPNLDPLLLPLLKSFAVPGETPRPGRIKVGRKKVIYSAWNWWPLRCPTFEHGVLKNVFDSAGARGRQVRADFWTMVVDCGLFFACGSPWNSIGTQWKIDMSHVFCERGQCERWPNVVFRSLNISGLGEVANQDGWCH